VRHRGPIALLLAAATFAVFFQVRQHEFVNYDDPAYIVDNPNLREGPSLEAVIRAFTTPHETNWIPLTWISLQIDYALYGADPAGYHLTNVALHALSSLLLFLVLSRMTGSRWRSAFVAAVFAVHPLHVESVAWASERKDALSGLLWMLALHAYAGYAERPGSLPRYAGVLACLVLGLLAKPMLVTLPFVLLLLDYWPLGRLRADDSRRLPDPRAFRRAVIEKLPMLLLVAAASAVTFAVQRSTGAMSHDGMLPFQYRLLNAVDSYALYLAKSFWPSGLAVFYPHPLRTLSALDTAVPALLLAAVTLGTARLAASRPYLVVGWLWFLGTLVPVIGLVQVGMQARADRYMYLPLIGLSIMVAWASADLLGRRRSGRIALAAAGTAALVGLGACARHQLTCWRDTISLFQRAAAVTEGNFVAHSGLGSALLAEGRLDEARDHFAEAARLKPRWVDPKIGLANVLAERGDLEAAIRGYREALRFDPDNVRALTNLGKALSDSGEPGRGIRNLRRALRLDRDGGPAQTHALLAQALAKRGDVAEAIRYYREAIERNPEFGEAHANLGALLARIGRLDEARLHLERAVELEIESADLHAGLATLALGSGRIEIAVRHYREALRLDPGLGQAANNLAWLLATSESEHIRDPAESIRLAEEAARATGASDPAVLDTLAAGYAAAGRFQEAIRTAAKAEELARATGDAALGGQIRARLALYRRGRPYLATSSDGEK
jgi:tetratricopeptide (TPR) repeat protein